MHAQIVSHLYPVTHMPSRGIFVFQQIEALQKRVAIERIIVPIKTIPYPIALLKTNWREDRRAAVSPDDPNREKVRLLHYPGLPGPWHSSACASLARALRRVEGPDHGIIHAHVIVPSGFAALKSLRTENHRLVVTVHGADLQKYTADRRARGLITEVLEQADGIVFVSRRLRDIARTLTRRLTDSRVIHNGAKYHDFDPSERPGPHISPQVRSPVSGPDPARSGPAQARFLILSAGRLERSKGFDILIKAVHRLRFLEDIRLRIIGEGPERKRIRSLIRSLHLSRRVELTGYLSHRDLAREMFRAQLFVLPSWSESFGIVYLEAMYQRRIIIGCRNQGVAEFVEDGRNGFLVPERNIEDLAFRIHDIYSHYADLRQIGENAHRTAMEFSWEKNVDQLVGFFRDLYPTSRQATVGPVPKPT